MVTADKVVVELQARTDQYLAKTRQAQTEFSQRMTKMQQSAARGEMALAKASGAGAAFFGSFTRGALAALAPMALFKKTLDTLADASTLAKTADRVGLTTKAFQELQFGMELAGVSSGEFSGNMEQFTRRMGEAATRGGRLADIMKANGIAIRDASGRIRSSETLLKEYADLIKNAASEQEAMTLATEAFGRSGTSMVLALRNGAQGLDDMTTAAEKAGVAIDDELLRRAEILDDEFTTLWKQFETSAKTAILHASFALRDMSKEIGAIEDAINDLIKDPSLRNLARAAVGDTATDFLMGAAPTNGKGDRVALPSRDQALDRLKFELNRQATILPDGKKDKVSGGSRDRAIEAAIREAEAVKDLIADLEFERSLIGLSAVEKEKANALRRAGSAATEEQRAKIAELAESIYTETEAVREQERAYAQLGQVGEDAINGIVDAFADGKLEADEMIQIVGNLIQQLLTMKNIGGGLGGFLSSIFGGGGGGGDPWAGLRVPSYSEGTNNHPGGLAGTGKGVQV